MLSLALGSVAARGRIVDSYHFEQVGGGTQARVWRGRRDGGSGPSIAVRLTPKPVELVARISALVDTIDVVECPKTLAVGQLDDGGQTWTVQVCTWIGHGAAARNQPFDLGQHIARLHQQLRSGGEQFADRQLSFERGPLPLPDRDLSAWDVDRHLWRERIFTWLATHGSQLRAQPIHGDLHWANVVGTHTGFGFIDFDKLMHAPPVFDLAKLIATGFFQVSPTVRLRERAVTDLLAGYQSVRPLNEFEHTAIEGYAVVVNEEIARLGHQLDASSYREQASAVGAWWANRWHRSRRDPFGIRAETPNTAKTDDSSSPQPSLMRGTR